MKRQLPSSLSVDPGLASEFNDVAGQRMDDVVQLRHPKSQFHGSNLQVAMSHQKGKLDGLLDGTPLSTFYPFGGGNILESFRTQNTSPMTPMSLPNREPSSNYVTPVTRVVKPFMSTLDAVSKYEIAIEYKDDPRKMDTFVAPHVGRMQGSPMTILNPATFNYTMCTMQLRHAKENPEEYYLKTPWDYWKDWSIGGIVSAEEMLDGSDSFTTSGISANRFSPSAGGYKIITLSTKGPEFLYNYFGSNISQGGKCYAIFKKNKVPGDYWLDNKPTIAALSGRHTVDTRLPMIRDTQDIVLPYQLSFVCLPNGGPLPREATMYRDERGVMCYDAIVIYLGTIFSVPIDHQFMPVTEFFTINPDTRRREPLTGGAYTDSRNGYDPNGIMFMKLILDCDDGIGAM